MRHGAVLFTVLLPVLGLASRAEAACNKPDLLDAAPPDGASDVPLNARLTARYAINADYLGEDIVIEQTGGSTQTLTGEWDAAETLLSVTPTLVAGAEYQVTWPKLRGLNTANLGRGKTVKLTVGSTNDEQPPSFAGISSLEWDVDRERDECTDNLEERYLFDFSLADASDDGGRDSLMLVLFQTRGPHISADAPVPVLIRRLPRPGATVRLSTPIDDGVGDVCFAGIVRDLTGKPSASGNREVCTKTVEPPFFAGCSTSPARRSSGIFAVLALIAAVVVGRGRRS